MAFCGSFLVPTAQVSVYPTNVRTGLPSKAVPEFLPGAIGTCEANKKEVALIKHTVRDPHGPGDVGIGRTRPPKRVRIIGPKLTMAHRHALVEPQNAGTGEPTTPKDGAVNGPFFGNKVCKPDALIADFRRHWPRLGLYLR